MKASAQKSSGTVQIVGIHDMLGVKRKCEAAEVKKLLV